MILETIINLYGGLAAAPDVARSVVTEIARRLPRKTRRSASLQPPIVG